MFIVDGDLTTPDGITIPVGAMSWRFSRGTGPGGQGVNTTDSRVELLVDLGALEGMSHAADRVLAVMGASVRIVVTTERSQLRNREIALQRLAERVDAAAIPVTPRRPTRPSRSSVRNRLEAKHERAQVKARRRPAGGDDS